MASRLPGERLLRAHDAELVSLRVGQDGPGLGAGLPDVDPAGPERNKTVDLLITIRGAAGQVQVHPVLDDPGIGDRHEADADGRVLGGPDTDLAPALGKNLPAERLRPEPGQARQVVGVDDDVVKSDRHADIMRAIPDRAGYRRAGPRVPSGRAPARAGSRRCQGAAATAWSSILAPNGSAPAWKVSRAGAFAGSGNCLRHQVLRSP